MKQSVIKQPRRGRPAIGKFSAICFPDKMLKDIDSLAGPGKRSAFVRAAIGLVLSSVEDLEVRHLKNGEVEFRKGNNDALMREEIKQGQTHKHQ